MRVFICVCLLVVAVGASLEELEAKFQIFKVKHAKSYDNQAEETKRFRIFKDNFRKIEEHNVLYDKDLVSYRKAINKFSDLTQEEFRSRLTLRKVKKSMLNVTSKHIRTGLAIPDSIDWRDDGQVSGVKDQGSCGSCWAFSVVGSTEAAYKRKNGKLLSFSEQQLIDCTTDINYGCGGGDLIPTFHYVQSIGLEDEADYPYTGSDDRCKFNTSKVATKISGFNAIQAGDENALLDAVGNIGPVSVAIDASFLGDYNSGIYQDDWCSSDVLDHAVLIVGYGFESGQAYWLIKNSWGIDWGDNGYFKIVRGANECGIAEDAVYPNIN